MSAECRCGKPTRDDAFACDDCLTELAKALGDVPWLDEQLEITITKQRAKAIESGAPSANQPIPWHERGSEARDNLRAILVSWIRLCDEEHVRHRSPRPGLPSDTLPAMAAWLMWRVPGLAFHPAAADAVDEITNAAAECHRIVTWKRRARTYLGTCGQAVRDDDGEVLADECPGEVYADEGAQVGYCDDCEQGVTVVIRQAEIEDRLDARLCTPAEIARYAVYLGLDAPRDRVRRRVNYWHRHKRIISRATNGDGDPMFRYGEVRGMLYAEFADTTTMGGA